MDALSQQLLALLHACNAFVAEGAIQVYHFAQTIWTSPDSSLYWAYVPAFLAWAWLAWRRNYGGRGLGSFLRFCFPKDTYLSRSSATDLQLLVLNRFLLLPSRLLKGFGAPFLAAWLLGLDPGTPLEARPLDPWRSLAYLAVWMTGAELGYYVAHRASHQIPILWEFHKVHHSATVLTPFTLWRKHPVFEMASGICVAVVRGFFLAGVALVVGGQFHMVHLFAFNLYDVIYRAAGQHLRHSHIWWAWGPRISHVFLSPAQHQIHHSYDPKHIDRNFGEILAIWDWLFGSLYVAREKEDLRFGLGSEDHGITNAATAYLVPLRNAGRLLLGRGPRQPAGALEAAGPEV